MENKKIEIVGKTKKGSDIIQYRLFAELHNEVIIRMNETEKKIFRGITKNRPFVIK